MYSVDTVDKDSSCLGWDGVGQGEISFTLLRIVHNLQVMHYF